MTQPDWSGLLVAWLHDPPDKALGIHTHEARARKYASVAVGYPVESVKHEADVRASIVERLPMPRADALKVEYDGFVRHPLSGKEIPAPAPSCDPDAVQAVVAELVRCVSDGPARFLTVWRNLPERLAELHPSYALLPADTRLPDHTIWHHMDATAAFHAAGGPEGAALVSVSLGPVQRFIEAARSLRDLWSGSWILSWLSFQAMIPILERLGPTSVLFPALRGVPLVDDWLAKAGVSGIHVLPKTLVAPCLPNRFLALTPADEAQNLIDASTKNVERQWRAVAEEVRRRLHQDLQGRWTGWDDRWDEQVNDYFEVTGSILPIRGCGYEAVVRAFSIAGGVEPFGDVESLRKLSVKIPERDRPSYAQNNVGEWAAQVTLAARLLEARRSVRRIPPGAQGPGPFPPKCSITGAHEQVGPSGLADSAAFWEAAQESWRLSGQERFGAIALVRRFAPDLIRKRYDAWLTTPDTATVAAADWLQDVGIRPEDYRNDDWSGQWLHWPTRERGEDGERPAPPELWARLQSTRASRQGPAPRYYAVLMMDGDSMGEWLRGQRLPQVRSALHRSAREYFERVGAGQHLQARRPISPAMHAAFSGALTSFASRRAPQTVLRHRGVLVYAGGDDVLALLPALQAPSCAVQLLRDFQGELGEHATLSAGLAVVHYKEDLRAALHIAREAEREAKKTKNRMVLAACRRSGEHSQSPLPWSYVDTFMRWVAAFRGQASDRWAYHVRREVGTLSALPLSAICAEIRRQVVRGEPDTRRAFSGVPEEFRIYAGDRAGAALEDWVKLVQSASFLARGRES